MAQEFKNWLDRIGVSYAFSGLSDFGITCAQDLTLLENDDLKDIMKEVGLKRTDQLKLTIAVRKLGFNSSPIMIISEAQHTALKNIGNRTKQAKEALNSLENAVKEMKDNYGSTKQTIDNTFKAFAELIMKRRLELLKEAEKQFQEKSAMLTTQTADLALIVAKLVSTQRDCERLMKIPKLDTLSSREEAVIDSVSKAIAVEFSDKPIVSPKIAYEASKQDVTRILSKEGWITGDNPPTLVIHCQPEEQAPEIKVHWENLCQTEAVLEFALQYAPAGDQKEEGERNWNKAVSVKHDAKRYTVTGLKGQTSYVVRMKARNDYGWGDFCDPVQVTTSDKASWKFVGFAEWVQDSRIQSDAQQDILMHAAAQNTFPGSRAASAEMYEDGKITNLPTNATREIVSFSSPNNHGNADSGTVSGHRLKGIYNDALDGTLSDLGWGTWKVLCVV